MTNFTAANLFQLLQDDPSIDNDQDMLSVSLLAWHRNPDSWRSERELILDGDLYIFYEEAKEFREEFQGALEVHFSNGVVFKENTFYKGEEELSIYGFTEFLSDAKYAIVGEHTVRRPTVRNLLETKRQNKPTQMEQSLNLLSVCSDLDELQLLSLPLGEYLSLQHACDFLLNSSAAH